MECVSHRNISGKFCNMKRKENKRSNSMIQTQSSICIEAILHLVRPVVTLNVQKLSKLHLSLVHTSFINYVNRVLQS